ncbi:hypothetical protein FACS1894219_08300 [Clostridia bacterium]|nr:hypothetical protein FACS1894219_08300 [Clostridia bacterium]
MSKSTNKSQSQGEVLVKSHYREMADMLVKGFERDGRDNTLIECSTEYKRMRPLNVDWQLPKTALLSSHPDDFYYPGHMEMNTFEAGNSFIDLGDRNHIFGGETYSLGRTIVMIKPTASTKPDFIYMADDFRESLDMNITVGRTGENPPQAFLIAGREDSPTYYFEPEEVCVLSVIYETLEREEGIFTYFNKNDGVLFTGFVTGTPGLKDGRFTKKLNPKIRVSKILTDKEKDLVFERFDKIAGQYAATVREDTKRKLKPVPRNSDEVHPFDLLKVNTQTVPQEKLRALCKVIRRNGERSQEGGYKEINLKNWNGPGGLSTNYEIKMKLTGGTECFFSFREDTGIDAVVIAGECDGGTSAFLVIKPENGEEYFFELEWFSTLSVHHKQSNGHIGIFTVFSQSPSVLYTDYCIAYPKESLGLLQLEGKNFPSMDDEATPASEETD